MTFPSELEALGERGNCSLANGQNSGKASSTSTSTFAEPAGGSSSSQTVRQETPSNNKKRTRMREATAKTETITEAVKKSYASLAKSADQTCCDSAKTEKLLRYGYSSEELQSLPETVIAMADGCGNPTGLGTIREGDTVLDLGSGGGVDVFLASRRVGPSGKVVGLDMTPEMVSRAWGNALKLNVTNVEFKLGEIENIPMEDESFDVVMSNCVICLSPDKERVFREMFRVLRPGGRLAIADEVALRLFSEEEKADPGKWCGCVTGAVTERVYAGMLENAGFEEVYVKQLRKTGEAISGVFSAFISGIKPVRSGLMKTKERAGASIKLNVRS